PELRGFRTTTLVLGSIDVFPFFGLGPGKRRSGRGDTVLGGEKPRKTASGVEFVRGEFEQQRAKFAERFSSFPRLPGLQALRREGETTTPIIGAFSAIYAHR